MITTKTKIINHWDKFGSRFSLPSHFWIFWYSPPLAAFCVKWIQVESYKHCFMLSAVHCMHLGVQWYQLKHVKSVGMQTKNCRKLKDNQFWISSQRSHLLTCEWKVSLISRKLTGVKFALWRDNVADIVHVSPSSKQIEGSQVVSFPIRGEEASPLVDKWWFEHTDKLLEQEAFTDTTRVKSAGLSLVLTPNFTY